MTLFRYDFIEFIERIKDLPYQQMLMATKQTLAQAENQSRGSKGAIRAQQQGSRAFVDAVGEFLFFLQVGSKPANVDEMDWPFYKNPVENLVKKGEMLPSVLSLFDDRGVQHSEEKL